MKGRRSGGGELQVGEVDVGGWKVGEVGVGGGGGGGGEWKEWKVADKISCKRVDKKGD